MSDNQGITPPHLQGFGSPSAGEISMSEQQKRELAEKRARKLLEELESKLGKVAPWTITHLYEAQCKKLGVDPYEEEPA